MVLNLQSNFLFAGFEFLIGADMIIRKAGLSFITLVINTEMHITTINAYTLIWSFLIANSAFPSHIFRSISTTANMPRKMTTSYFSELCANSRSKWTNLPFFGGWVRSLVLLETTISSLALNGRMRYHGNRWMLHHRGYRSCVTPARQSR